MESLTEIKVQQASMIQQQIESNRRLENIEKKLEDKVVTKDEHNAVDDRVTAIEDTLKWLVRTIAGSLLLAGLTALGIGKKVGIL